MSTHTRPILSHRFTDQLKKWLDVSQGSPLVVASIENAPTANDIIWRHIADIMAETGAGIQFIVAAPHKDETLYADAGDGVHHLATRGIRAARRVQRSNPHSPLLALHLSGYEQLIDGKGAIIRNTDDLTRVVGITEHEQLLAMTDHGTNMGRSHVHRLEHSDPIALMRVAWVLKMFPYSKKVAALLTRYGVVRPVTEDRVNCVKQAVSLFVADELVRLGDAPPRAKCGPRQGRLHLARSEV